MAWWRDSLPRRGNESPTRLPTSEAVVVNARLRGSGVVGTGSGVRGRRFERMTVGRTLGWKVGDKAPPLRRGMGRAGDKERGVVLIGDVPS